MRAEFDARPSQPKWNRKFLADCGTARGVAQKRAERGEGERRRRPPSRPSRAEEGNGGVAAATLACVRQQNLVHTISLAVCLGGWASLSAFLGE